MPDLRRDDALPLGLGAEQSSGSKASMLRISKIRFSDEIALG
jgi:hypothetical protein